MSEIIADPEILGGKPVVAGTRISVEHILELLASGMSESEIVASYPALINEDIREVLRFASSSLKNDVVIDLETHRESR